MSYVIGGQPPTTPVAERRSLVGGVWVGCLERGCFGGVLGWRSLVGGAWLGVLGWGA
jgi:hypothetical protein